MDFEVVFLPAMVIVGSELRTTWMNKECYSTIPAFWQQQRSENSVQTIYNKVDSDVVLGLYANYSSDFSLSSGYYSLIIGSPVGNTENVPHGMVVREVPAAKYAVFTAKSLFDQSIEKTWLEEIWQNKDINRTFVNDFEWYNSQSTDDENSTVKIYISIE